MEIGTLKRIKIYIDYKGFSVMFFEKEVGMSNGSFASQLKKNKTIGVDKLENILKKYPEINPEWLLTGKGSMLKDQLKEENSSEGLNVVQLAQLLAIINNKEEIISGLRRENQLLRDIISKKESKKYEE
ncbi:hypothetical protein [Flavobacterium psychrotolerans]|uniref:hypothetical protein n=1 Tax=Flavobacterium psychrotolerans TaxID=2169410 RepID=UPI001AA03911|nr:hypothetical protein [Flavobacterium psychrotolerans]